MSFFSDLYNGFRSTVSNIYNKASQGIGLVKQAKDWLSEKVDQLSSIPFIGDAIGELADKVENTPFLAGWSLHDVSRGLDRLNEYVNSPYLTQSAALVDQYLSQGAKGLDQIAGSPVGQSISQLVGAGS